MRREKFRAAPTRVPVHHGDASRDATGTWYSGPWDCYLSPPQFWDSASLPEHVTRFGQRQAWMRSNRRAAAELPDNLVHRRLFKTLPEPIQRMHIVAAIARSTDFHRVGSCAVCARRMDPPDAKLWLCPACSSATR